MKGIYRYLAVGALGLYLGLTTLGCIGHFKDVKKPSSKLEQMVKKPEGWRFAVLGDTQDDPKEQKENSYGIAQRIPNDERVTVLNVGDLTTNGSEGLWKVWHQANEPLKIGHERKNVPDYIAAVGNHDLMQPGSVERWKENLPAQAGLSAYEGLIASHYGLYGSVKHDNALFIWIDSNKKRQNQEKFLRKTLERSKQDKDIDWRFLMYHHPVITADRDEHLPPIKKVWNKPNELWNTLFRRTYTWVSDRDMSYLDKYLKDIDIVFSGHDHLYSRTCPITDLETLSCDDQRGSYMENPDGYIQIISGGGGGDIKNKPNRKEHWDKQASTHHFIEFAIDGKKLDAYVWDTDAQDYPALIDHFTINKGLEK